MRDELRSWGLLALALALPGCSCQAELPPDGGDDQPPAGGTPTPTGGTIDTGPEPPCPVPEVEPNNIEADATVLPIEQLGCGVLDQPGDIDLFVTEVPEEGWLSVATAARSIGSFANIQLVLSPPEGSAAIRIDDEGTTDASLLFPGTPGTWLVQVSEQNFQGSDAYFYQVAVSSAKAPVEWTVAEVEPNDDLATAMPLASGDAVFGDMDDSLDGDWYRIDIPPGKHTLHVTVDAYAYGSAGDFSLWLSDASANLLPLGCDPMVDCEVRGDPLDPALHDPVVDWESAGNETLYVKIDEYMFWWGPPTWYVLRVDLEGP